MKTVLDALKKWLQHDPFTQSAATAYYAIFSLPGLLIIIIAFAALFFEEQRVEQAVLGHVQEYLGSKAAGNIKEIVYATQKGDHGGWAFVAGGAALLFGATGLFVQLQRSFNRIWEVEVRKSAGLGNFIKARLLSFGLILAIGFLLLISLTLTALITVFSEWLAIYLSPTLAGGLVFLNMALSFLMTTALFTLIFKVLPDAEVRWRVAFLGGALSTLLFTVGQYALNMYLNFAEPQSAFGAAGTLILLMLWVSYSCMILLIGAEFAKTYAENYYGYKVKAKDFAKKKITKT